MPAREKLFALERELDQKVRELPVWGLPFQSIITALNISVDGLVSGDRFGTAKRNPEAGAALASRLSYLIPFFPFTSSSLGLSSPAEALSIVDQKHRDDLRAAVVYSHFCEIMPQVRNDIYSVDITADRYSLGHANAEISDAEVSDIVLTEISLAHDYKRPPSVGRLLVGIAEAWPRVKASEFYECLNAYYQHFLSSVSEDELVFPADFLKTFGFSKDEFNAVRAALTAFSNLCLGLAQVQQQRWHLLSEGREAERYVAGEECLEWVSPCLKEDFVLGIVQILTRANASSISAIARHLTLIADRPEDSVYGDGFFPPLIQVNGHFLFSPHMIRLMLPERNLFYVINRRDKSEFDTKLSSSLEPKLISDAIACLRQCREFELIPNVKWSKGEVDLFIYDRKHNHCIQVQAKAALPPQGARMTRNLQSRTIEGIKQLSRFNQLNAEERDAICSRALGRSVANVQWSSALLSRSGFGGAAAWRQFDEITPVNIALLKMVVSKIKSTGDVSATRLLYGLRKNFGKIKSRSVAGWQPETLNLFGVQIELPLLKLNHSYLRALENRISRIKL